MLDLSSYTKWSELTSLVSEYSPFKLVEVEHRWLSIDGLLPYSINEAEFNIIKDHIIEQGYTNAFDLATGCGISALAIGYAVKVNNGKALSMDSYSEELSGRVPVRTDSGQIKVNANGYRLAKWLKDTFELSGLTLAVGWSPKDAITFIQEYLDSKIDFVMLDCPKSDDDLTRDLGMLKPFLAERYSIFIHDIHTFSSGARIAKDALGITYIDYPGLQQKYPLGFIQKT